MRGLEYERPIIGYHGCDRAVVEAALLRGDRLRASENTYDWLGHGVYFWEYGPERALAWARQMQRRGKVREPAVLGAFIHLGRWFDLTDLRATHALSDWYGRMQVDYASADRVMPSNLAVATGDHDLLLRKLDCAVLNYAMEQIDREAQRVEYQTIRGVFREGEPVYPGARIYTKTHVQVVVRDPGCILGYFRPAAYTDSVGRVH